MDLLLVCIPHAGGSAGLFRRWGARLPPFVDVVSAQLPGRGSRMDERPLLSIEEMAADLHAALLERRPHPPIALLGHSMGAWVALELGHALRDSGNAPIQVFVSAKGPPPAVPPGHPIADLSDDAFLAAMIARYDAVPGEVLRDRAAMAMLLPTLRADMAAVEAYRGTERGLLDCGITALGGSADATVLPKELERWAEWTTGWFRLDLHPGDHFFLYDPDSGAIGSITRDLRLTLRDQGGRRPPPEDRTGLPDPSPGGPPPG